MWHVDDHPVMYNFLKITTKLASTEFPHAADSGT